MYRYLTAMRFTLLFLCGFFSASLLRYDILQIFMPENIAVVFSMFFVVFNSYLMSDIFDEEVDRYTNRDQSTLASGKNTLKDYIIMSQIVTFLFLVLTYIYPPIPAVKAILIVFYIFGILYSAPPFKLKRYIWSNILVVVSWLLTFIAGYIQGSGGFIVTPELIYSTIAIVFLFGWLSILSDIKDAEFDPKYGVHTLPSIYGIEKTKYLLRSILYIFIMITTVFTAYTGKYIITTIILSIIAYEFISVTSSIKDFVDGKSAKIYIYNIWLPRLIIIIMFLPFEQILLKLLL